MKINERIKKLRIDNNLTQEDLAKICLVSRNAVSKWENDRGYPNLDSMKLLCKHFNISLDQLISDEENIEGVSKELAISALEENKKLDNKFTLSLIVLLNICYLIFGILFRELLFKLTHDSGFAYYLLIGPIIFIVSGSLAGLVLKKFRYVFLSAWFSFFISFLLDCLFPSFGSAFFQILYFLLYLGFALVVLFIKNGKIFLFTKKIQIQLVIETKLNMLLSIIAIAITLIAFILLLSISIYKEVNNFEQIVIADAFNAVPIFWILVFLPIIVLETIWLILSLKKFKGEKNEKQSNI